MADQTKSPDDLPALTLTGRLTHVKAESWLKACTVMAQTGNMAEAARAIGVTRQAVYLRRQKNTVFGNLMDQAEAIYLDSLVAEVDRRAFQGVDKPVFYQGRRVDTIKEFSDLLAMFRIKKLDTSYRDKQDTNINIGVGITLNEK